MSRTVLFPLASSTTLSMSQTATCLRLGWPSRAMHCRITSAGTIPASSTYSSASPIAFMAAASSRLMAVGSRRQYSPRNTVSVHALASMTAASRCRDRTARRVCFCSHKSLSMASWAASELVASMPGQVSSLTSLRGAPHPAPAGQVRNRQHAENGDPHVGPDAPGEPERPGKRNIVGVCRSHGIHATAWRRLVRQKRPYFCQASDIGHP